MSRAANAAAREHPQIVELRQHQARVNELGEWLAGSEFADERGWLDPEERTRFEQARADFPWSLGALHAHEQRVRLDHPKVFARWISGEIGAARREGRPIRDWQALRSRQSRWRLDIIEHPPRGDLFELELRTTFRVTEVETGRVVLERTHEASAVFAGLWQPDGERGSAAMRIERDTAFVRGVDGSTEQIDLSAD